MSVFKNILIIKWGALGDIIAGTIAILAIRQQYPAAKITLLTNSVGEQLVPPGSIANEVMNINTLLEQHGRLGLLWQLRRQHFDLGINLRFYSQYAALLAIFGASSSAGGGPTLLRRFYTYKTRDPITIKTRQEYQYIAQHAEAAGASNPNLQAFIHISQEDRAFVKSWLQLHSAFEQPILLLAPSASNACKCWPIENFIKVVQLLLAEIPQAKIVLNVMPHEQILMDKIKDAIPSVLIHPPLTIGQLGALTEQAKLVLCNNSGLMNVAHALNIPLVCVNTAYDWVLSGPREICVNAFSKNAKGEEYKEKSEAKVQQLISSIPVETVWYAVKKLWSEGHS